MAVHRVSVRCQTCRQSLVLRIVIAGGDQPFVFACPKCGTEARSRFYAQPEGPYEFRSEDLDHLPEEPPGALAVAVATDLPVHVSFVGTPADEPGITPFIYLASALDAETADLMPAVERMRASRSDVFPTLRRAAAFWAREDLKGVEKVMMSMPGAAIIDWRKQDVEQVYERAVASLYAPFEDVAQRASAAKELLRVLRDARARDSSEFASLFVDFEARALPEHRQRLVQAAFSALQDVDALLPAMWAERMEGRLDLTDYRVMRDDFAILKGRYQDLFELASRSLAFTAPFANLALRGDVRAYADGATRTTAKARKEKAFKREGWLGDFPVASRLYEAMSRHTRNDIGHTLVRHDVARGVLIYDDGDEENYIAFLVDVLHAVRISHYLLDVVYVFDQAKRLIRP